MFSFMKKGEEKTKQSIIIRINNNVGIGYKLKVLNGEKGGCGEKYLYCSTRVLFIYRLHDWLAVHDQ